ncbi:MAG: translation initiation factor IF-2 N-terminal domain-containing protein, partial [Deltaproteobacteria bacterium]|nr:translation initiation factor IF-2 N-terminal domain-containing protein [Deltaproteobacteria bacterium]
MVKMRVHQLAKELGLEPKDLLAHMEKMGLRGKKTQGSLEDDEVARVRAALAQPVKPQVTVGEEKVVADRVVTREDESLGEVQSREQVVERRVRTNVIRRRTSREVIAHTPPLPLAVEPQPAQVEETAPEEIPSEAPPIEGAPSEAQPPTAEAVVAQLENAEEEAPQVEAEEAQPALAAPQEEPERPRAPVAEPVTEPPKAAPQEAPRGARILGKIDLRRTGRPAPVPRPAPTPVKGPFPPQTALPEAQRAEARSEAPGIKPKEAGEGAEKPAKAVKHKKRIVKKQEVLELREREFRSGRLPRKKRALPGKEQKKTEITVPKASKRVIKISEVVTVGDLSRELGVKAGEVIKKLMQLGMMATINQTLDADTATLVAADFDHQV